MLRQALLLAVFAVSMASGIPRADEPPRTISVQGHGEVSASPDIAYATVGVRTVADTARDALSANSAAMQSIFESLREAGVADRDMQTTALSLNPRWGHKAEQDGSRTQVLIGYEASNQLQVTCRDLPKLGELLDALADAGANEMRGIAFDIADKDRLMDEARVMAVQDGRAKAELLAHEAGAELGRVLSISEAGAQVPVFRGRAMAEMAAAAVPIAEGEQTISAVVLLTYEIR